MVKSRSFFCCNFLLFFVRMVEICFSKKGCVVKKIQLLVMLFSVCFALEGFASGKKGGGKGPQDQAEKLEKAQRIEGRNNDVFFLCQSDADYSKIVEKFEEVYRQP